MIAEVAAADAKTLAGFDEVIDVRSPAEFAQDHAPGAINLPVLSDAQRAEVGEIYVQRSKFDARRLGAAYVSRNIADHLAGPLAERQGGYRPLVYCWRGGQRSHAMATVLSQVGWRVGLLRGGYRTYRRGVTGALYDGELGLDLVLLDGGTGAGKTALLHALQARGAQTLDLEALASHRGSLFGDDPQAPQPSQKLFESRLAAALSGLDPGRPVFAEAEASRIGELRLPPALWRAMSVAPAVEVETPLEVRVDHLARAYRGLLDDLDALQARLARLPRHHGRAQRDAWLEAARRGDAAAVARGLVERHYDPSYAASRGAHRPRLGVVRPHALDSAALAQAADAVLAAAAAWTPSPDATAEAPTPLPEPGDR